MVQKVANAMVNLAQTADFYLQVDGQRYPINKSVTSGVESTYMTIGASSTSLESFTIANDKQRFNSYTWKSNDAFSSGIPTSNGSVSIDVTFSETPTENSSIISLIAYDGLLLIDQNGANLMVDA